MNIVFGIGFVALGFRMRSFAKTPATSSAGTL
jgi:hypothetical protein